jgi:glycosyltransferase involved in cell wall biosynthesis
MSQSPLSIERRSAGKDRGIPDLAVIILSLNEEHNLPDCLKSIQGLECKIYMVDSGSTDRSVAIATAAGAVVAEHPFEHYAAQRNWAMRNLGIEASWMLHLDADERLTPELVTEINQLLSRTSLDAGGFLLRKRTVFMGRWIRHGGHYPSYHLRLFRTGQGRCEDRLYDQHFLAEGRIDRLQHDYIDVVSSSLSTWTIRHCRWAQMEVQEMLEGPARQGQVIPTLAGNPIQRRRWWRNTYGRAPLFARALSYWAYRYFIRCGFLDGTEGLIFHFLQGFWFRFLIDAMIWERRKERASARHTTQ